MPATNMPPSHYELHGFHYQHKESDLIGSRRYCQFELVFKMDGKAMRHEVRFDQLLDAAEEHLPDVHGYIKKLEQEIDANSLDYTELVDALDAEGFDFELLVRAYLDHLSADRFYNVDAPPPEMLEAAHKIAAEIKEIGFDELRRHMLVLQKATEYIELDKRLFKAAKRLMNQSFVRLNEFDKKKLEEFFDLVNHYSWQIAIKIIGVRWMGTDEEDKLDKWEATFEGMTPEGRKARILKDRLGHQEPYPHPFSLEIVAMEDWWEVVGRNEVMLYAHVVAEEGYAYLDVRFKDIRDEAFLYAPALYERILELESSLEGIMPKEAEVVKALLEEGWDLVPLLYSYSKEYGYMKTHILCQNAFKDSDNHPNGEYYEYLEGRTHVNYPNYIPWSQKCSTVKDKLVKLFMGILQKDFPEVMESEDYRVTAWAVQELKTLCSNMMHDIKQEFSELHEGGVVWPAAPVNPVV